MMVKVARPMAWSSEQKLVSWEVIEWSPSQVCHNTQQHNDGCSHHTTPSTLKVQRLNLDTQYLILYILAVDGLKSFKTENEISIELGHGT